MEPYVILLIFVIVIGIIIAIIIDKIDKKNRNGKIDKDKVSDAEQDLNEKKKENMDEYQRNLSQTLTSGLL